MLPISLTEFVHPHSVYRLQYPSHWEHRIEKDGEQCGFGPRDRDNVGLWISILPISVDTDRFAENLPLLLKDTMDKVKGSNIRPDPTLRHTGYIADTGEEGKAGHFWLLAGGDVVLFASSRLPIAEREIWTPLYAQVMASLQITRDQHLIRRKIVAEVFTQLVERFPEHDYKLDGERIRGKDRVVFLGNLFRDVLSAPDNRDKLVANFVERISQTPAEQLGEETWEVARPKLLPVLKPKEYIDPNTPTEQLVTREWLSDVLVCYVLNDKQMLRFVTRWDMARWEITPQVLDDHAIANLSKLPWPTRLIGARARDEGRVIVVDTGDSLGSSRLLHPDLHQLFCGTLGNPFLAGIPCRNRLVLYSDKRSMRNQIRRRLQRDHDESAYPITPRPFLVTRDGIAPAK